VLTGPARTAAAAGAGTLLGCAVWLVGLGDAASAVWAATTLLLLVPLTWSVLRTLARGDVGVDAIALLAMGGALAVGEYLAGAVIAVMLAGGNALEAYAQGRAGRELSALVSKIPTTARIRRGDEVVTVPVDRLGLGDRMMVNSGDTVGADARLASAHGVFDTSSLTGEPLPVDIVVGEQVASGSVNAGPPVELDVIRPAVESTYAAIVRLVESAQGSKAPFVRMADRYAVWFLGLTVALAGVAWLSSGDPVRAVAVLVVATPCPLILAAPVALVSGVSRAARAGVIVKGAGVIERLAAARTVLLDKTGTLTLGTPVVDDLRPMPPTRAADLLAAAASLDQASSHVVATALVTEAGRRAMVLTYPSGVEESPGQGLTGRVDGSVVALGSRAYLRARGIDVPSGDPATGRADVQVAIDDRYAGRISVTDRLRPDAAGLVGRLRENGIRDVVLATGDQALVAQAIAHEAGIDEVHSELSAEDKLELIRALRQRSSGSVVMVGDGVNDAPALAVADVGIALAAGSATAASQTADAVIVVDRVTRVADAIAIGQRSMRIARQSVLAGIGLSVCGMALAAVGLLPPIAGALAQEAIDVGVILNALRALRGPELR
jgi:heavy metal translocating P-type ATPase